MHTVCWPHIRQAPGLITAARFASPPKPHEATATLTHRLPCSPTFTATGYRKLSCKFLVQEVRLTQQLRACSTGTRRASLACTHLRTAIPSRPPNSHSAAPHTACSKIKVKRRHCASHHRQPAPASACTRLQIAGSPQQSSFAAPLD
ncbi:hypothetical protein CC86DRAFT_53235 [Ophiobolus disseminans]|uniref:Uncharacterized protein n=1 Tax=Ophiobolus disseminans TaxID=1469910 RepID=A0A6A6ZVB2_9PLEO|nr:hypothetical protein CC86DRAFT_53235 [Ophiobolus disseminans]